MTTGEPVVARVAMKPLPTLTKPLRSVDIETKRPAEALRERTDSCTVPAAGVVGEAMVALELAPRLPRASSAGTECATCSRRCPLTVSASNGGGRDEHRLRRCRARPGPQAAGSWSSSVSCVRGSRGSAATPRSGSAGRWLIRTSCSRSASASRSRVLRREGEEAFREREQELVLELLGGAGPGDRAARRRGARAPAGARRAGRPRRRACRGGPRHGLERARRTPAARWRATASASPSCTPPGARCTSRWPPWCWPTAAEKTPAFVDALAAPGRGDLRMIWAAQGYPVAWGPERWTRRASCSPIAGAASSSPTSARGGSTASGSRAWPPPSD